MTQFSVIYLDPPWKYRSRADHKTRFRGGAYGHYPLMATREIAALPIPDIAAKDCALCMWCTYPMLDEQITLFKHWGFHYSTILFNWTKLNPRGYDWPADDRAYRAGKEYVLYSGDGLFHSVFFGPGYYAKANADLCLLGTRGRMKPITNKVSSIILAPRREHSRKPDEARARIVQLWGDVLRVELFATQRVPGWVSVGNVVDGLDIGTSLARLAAQDEDTRLAA